VQHLILSNLECKINRDLLQRMKVVSKLNLLIFVVFFFLYLSSLQTVNPRSPTISYLSPLSLANRQRAYLFDRYLISSELSLGRFSNLKISISELLGLSLVLNRTAILPKFEQCMNSEGIEMNDDIYFDQLFDSFAVAADVLLFL